MKLFLKALFDTHPDPEWEQLLIQAGAEKTEQNSAQTTFNVDGETFIVEHINEPVSTIDILLNTQNIPQEIDTSWTVPLLAHNAHVIISCETSNPLRCAQIMITIAAQMNPEAALWSYGALVDSATLRAIQSGDVPETFGLFTFNEWTDDQNIALVATGTRELIGQNIIYLDSIEEDNVLKILHAATVYLLENPISQWPETLSAENGIEIGVTNINHLTLLKLF